MAATAAQTPSAASKLRRTYLNQMSAVSFAALMLGFIALFTIFHVVRMVLQRRRSKNKGTLTRISTSGSRALRSIILRRVPGFVSVGHTTVFALYTIINVTLAFAGVDWSAGTINNWAKRLGWVAACNLALVTFLALKNTPLAFLTAYSHERLNVLHRIAGYNAVVCMIFHSVVYVSAFAVSNSLDEYKLWVNVAGVIGGIAMLIIAATAFFLRRLHYEVFYIIHVTMFMLIIVVLSMHHPIATGLIWFCVFAGAIWICDRVIRAVRIAWFSYGNTATITPLARGGVRIVLKRPAWRAVPGAHIFIWIPKIRAFETHPFTVSSVNPIELVVAAHDGFTRDLLEYASSNPGASLRASMDGPYGALPNFLNFDQVVLIAGGSGASFTFGIAIDLIRKYSASKPDNTSTARPLIHFIWVVREQESISWFTNQICELHASPLISLTIHVTRSVLPSSTDPSLLAISTEAAILSANEKEAGLAITPDPSSPAPSTSEKTPIECSTDVEKSGSGRGSISSLSSSSAPSLLSGRPDIPTLINDIVSNAEDYEKVMVSACGPSDMMNVTRKSVANCLKASISGRGASVELHLEQYGW